MATARRPADWSNGRRRPNASEPALSGIYAAGVERALGILGAGFAGHPRNEALREALRSGSLTPAGLHEQLLRVVYRLIFLFVAEDRTLDGSSLLHPPDDSATARIARERYAEHYGTARATAAGRTDQGFAPRRPLAPVPLSRRAALR